MNRFHKVELVVVYNDGNRQPRKFWSARSALRWAKRNDAEVHWLAQ